MGWPLAAGVAAGTIGAALIGADRADKASDKAMGRAQTMRGYALGELAGIKPLDLPELLYTPEDYQMISGATPIQYEQMPQLDARTVDIDPTTRNAQLAALQDLTARADEGLSAQDRYNFALNRRNAEMAARGQQGAIRESMRRRGMSGTGLEAVLAQQAAQGNMENLALSQAQQAAANANMRMQATGAMGALAGNIRGQDFEQEMTNTDILNAFAKFNSERERMIANANIDKLNRKAQEDVAEQRAVTSQNIAQRNEADLMKQRYNIDRAREEQVWDREQKRQMAGAHLDALPEIYAGGAADSARQQHLFGTIGQGIVAGGNIYAQSQRPQGGDRPTINIYGGGQGDGMESGADYGNYRYKKTNNPQGTYYS